MSKSVMMRTNVEDVENQGCKKATNKTGGLAVRAPLQERPVLKAVNVPRVQPSRAAKSQGPLCEKVFQKPADTKKVEDAGQRPTKYFAVPVAEPTFTIYEDEPSVDESSAVLPQCEVIDVDEWPSHNVELQSEVKGTGAELGEPSSTGTTYFNSPMVMESSCEEEEELEKFMAEDNRFVIEERLEQVVNLPEYRQDIYKYLREAEVRFQPKPDYMRKQADITHTMRSILVDWLVEVAEEYKLSCETLCLTLNCIDRFLSVMSVVRSKLQLVGAAAMFIASKYEEVYPPEVREFVYITDDTYTMKQVLQMEQMILKVLSFSLTAPTVNAFSTELLKEMALSDEVTPLTMYMVELTLLDGEPFLKYLPSVVATSCFCYAAHVCGERYYMPRIKDNTGYTFEDLRDCVVDIHNALLRAPSHPQQAIFQKFSQDKFCNVARVSLPPNAPQEFP